MTSRRVFRCIVDDTVLIAHITEIKKWILNGSISLSLPIHTLERLALQKQDSSQAGINARKTVEFLDQVTEGGDGLPVSAISLQGPTERFHEWSEVEEHIVCSGDQIEKETELLTPTTKDAPQEDDGIVDYAKNVQPVQNATNVLSQMLLNKLNFAREADLTPPTSPGSSNDRSVKYSPDPATPKPTLSSLNIPPSLRPLINAVVWQVAHVGTAPMPHSEVYFVSNSADVAALMRNFGIKTKSAHQLRQAINLEDQESRNQSKYSQKHPISQLSSEPVDGEPRAMFKYEENSDEEVVFQPRGCGTGPRHTTSASGSPKMEVSSQTVQSVSQNRRSTRRLAGRSIHQNKPEIPIEEIDPNSFDRGSFGRATSHRLVLGEGNVSNGFKTLDPLPRGSVPSLGPSRSLGRGSFRGSNNSPVRGRGRLFVP